MNTVAKCILLLICMAMIAVYPIAGIPGDVDKNGIVNETDIYIIVGYILRECTLDDDQMQLADMNEDGRVTSSDLTKLVRMYGMSKSMCA